MKLNTYMKQKSQVEFAALVGVTPSMISYILSGKRKPSPRLARRIEEATGGKVTRAEILPEVYA